MRKYFYRDGDQIKKYVYCTRGCQEAYKQNDIGNSILKVNNTTFLCSKCAKILGIQAELHGLAKNNSQTKETEFVSIFQDVGITTPTTIPVSQQTELDTKPLEQVSTLVTIQQTSEVETIQQLPLMPETIQNSEVITPSIEQNTISNVMSSDCFSENDFFVFVLKCKDETFYVGATSNIEKAIKYHNQGCGSSHTRPKERRPVSLIEFQKTTTSEAKNVKDSLSKKYGIRGKDEMQTM
jgi:putative endonuclease